LFAEEQYRQQIAGPAADVIATVVTAFSKGAGWWRSLLTTCLGIFLWRALLLMHCLKGLSSIRCTGAAARTQRSAAHNARALPERSIRNAIDALAQVVKSTPFLPEKN